MEVCAGSRSSFCEGGHGREVMGLARLCVNARSCPSAKKESGPEEQLTLDTSKSDAFRWPEIPRNPMYDFTPILPVLEYKRETRPIPEWS